MDLTLEDVALLKTVRDGADIFGFGTARKLRALGKKAPHLLTICDVMGDYPGVHRQPYFGAIATADGKALLDELT